MSDSKANPIADNRAPEPTFMRLIQQNADRALGSWLTWLLAILLAIPLVRAIGKLFYLPSSYSDFIVGHLAWNFDGKIADYALLLVFIAALTVCVFVQVYIAGLLQSRVGEQGWTGFQNLAAYCSVPAFMWLGDALFVRSDLSLWLLQTSSAMIVSLLLVVIAAGIRDIGFWGAERDSFGVALRSAVVSIWMAPFSAIGLGIAGIKFSQLFDFNIKFTTTSMSGLPAISAIAAIAAALLIIMRVRDVETLSRRLAQIQIASQIGIPLLFLAVVPDQWTDASSGLRTPSISALGWGVPITLTLAGYCILVLNLLRLKRNVSRTGTLSLLAVCAVLIFIKLPPGAPPSISPDDYHFGEILVPWWSVARFGLIPFSDFEPARGLVNYARGLSNYLFLDGTAGSLTAANYYWTAAVLLVAFFGCARLLGAPIAFIALLLMPRPNTLSEIDIYNSLCLVVLCYGFLNWRAINWLLVSLLVCLSAVLFAPGQGGILALGLSPLALVAFTKAWNHELRITLAKAAIALLVVTLLIMPTSFGSMLIGAFRYGLEQVAVNSAAHGIAWHHSLSQSAGWNVWIWEAFRASWILLSGIALVVAIRAAIGGDTWPWERRRRALAFSIPIFLMTILFVMRAAGRIDPGNPSRLGLAGIWMWALLAPLLLYAWSGRKTSGSIVVATFIPAFMLAPLFERIPPEKIRFPTERQQARIAFTNGREIGVPNIGLAIADKNQIDRLQRLKHVLDRSLTPDQTYLDATNRGAQYFYFDRRPPISNIATYNAVSNGQQSRAVAQLENIQPPLVLAASESILWDGGPLGLRAHLIYRHLMFHYTPAIAPTDPTSVWMAANKAVDRLNSSTLLISESREQTLALLDRAFRIENLRFIPSSWGYSWSTLKSAAQIVHGVGSRRERVRSLVERQDGSYDVSGPDPSIDYTADGLSGRKAGLMVFDFRCLQPTNPGVWPVIVISWTANEGASNQNNTLRFSARDGRQIVPMDAFPRWLLADNISDFQIGFADDTCRKFTISGVTLMQRTNAE